MLKFSKLLHHLLDLFLCHGGGQVPHVHTATLSGKAPLLHVAHHATLATGLGATNLGAVSF